jgi:hypothetical protein
MYEYIEGHTSPHDILPPGSRYSHRETIPLLAVLLSYSLSFYLSLHILSLSFV